MLTRRRIASTTVAAAVAIFFAWSPSQAQTVPAAGQSPTIDKIKKDGKLRVGVIVAWPWLGQDPKTGKYIGAAADLGDGLAKNLGVTVEHVPTGWDTVVAGIQAKQFEVTIAPLFATPKRMAVIDFANYTEAGTCYAVLKSNTKVAKLDDLNKPDVLTGTFTGTGTEQEFAKKYTKGKYNSVVQPPGGGTRVLEVINGRIDTAAFDSPIALALEAKYPQIKIVPDARECIAKPDIPIAIGVGFAKGDAVFAKFLAESIEKMKPDLTKKIEHYSTLEFLQDQLGQ